MPIVDEAESVRMIDPRVQPRLAPEGTDGSVSLFWMAAVLLRERRLLLAFALGGAIIGSAVALLRRETFTTRFAFLPQASQEPRAAGLANLVGQFGISLDALTGQSDPPQLYSDLLVTTGVLGPIARDSFALGSDSGKLVPLAAFLRVHASDSADRLEKTLRRLRTRVISRSVAARTNIITVTVRTGSPFVSYSIADRLLQGLNNFNLTVRQSRAHEERRFTEGRLEEARASLRRAEDGLQGFLQANRQYASSPALTFQKDRLQREVTRQEQLVTALAQRYEENRIQEVRDTPVLTVVEPPTLAARHDPRLRVLIILLATAASLCVGMMIVIWVDLWNRQRAIGHDPGLALLASEWKRIRPKRQA